MSNKRGFEFSFAWLFAIIVGAIILFLAIYGANKLIRTGKYQLDTVTAKQLSIIFEPLETGLASGKSTKAELKEETRIYNECSEEGSFGKNYISLSTKLGFKGWKEPGGKISIPNKYIFSQNTSEGKTVYFFSKPFEMPWKVSEIIFLSTEKYCFGNAPEEVENEVLGLNLGNVKIGNCSSEDVKVCFGSGDEGDECEIKVFGNCIVNCESEYDYGFVEKENEEMIYVGSLLYAGIFSSPEIYECNVKRLMERLRRQALLYADESNFLTGKCGSIPSAGLLELANSAKILDSSEDLLEVYDKAKEVNEQNENAECKLW